MQRMGKCQNMVNRLHLAYVATTEEWATRVTKNCRGSSIPITSTVMQQNMFRNWNKYLAQMYRASILSSTDNESFIILHYYWANFGWGKRHTDGMLVSHPHEVWLYTCKGAIKDEWYLEAPIKICLPRYLNLTAHSPKIPVLLWNGWGSIPVFMYL